MVTVDERALPVVSPPCQELSGRNGVWGVNHGAASSAGG